MRGFYKVWHLFFLFLALGLSSLVNGHSVQVAYCANCNGDLRIWVEHWHSTEAISSTTMTLNVTVNGVTFTQIGSPNVGIQNTPFGSLPGCSSPLTVFGSCPGTANTYNDWVAYDFIGMPVGVPITITITSGNTAFTTDGCSMYPASTGIIIIPPPPIFGDVIGCSGSGAMIGPFNFPQGNTWTNDNTAIGLAASGTGNIPAFIPPYSPTVQVANITLSNTCSSSSFSITVNPVPYGANGIGAGADITTCLTSALGSLGTTPTSGYTYSWSPAAGLNNATLSNPTVALNSAGITTYTVTATALNCSSTDVVVVNVNPLPTATIVGTISVCKDAASPDITFTGGASTAPYIFTYNINSGTNQTVSTTSGNSVTVAVPTTVDNTYVYSLVSVQDASSTTCSQTQSGSATVTVNPLPTATIAGTTTVCRNAAAPNVTFTGAMATAPYTFTYTINGITQPTVTTLSGNSISIPAPTTTAGTFIYSLVSVKESSPTICSLAQSGTVTVIVNPLPTATVTGTTAVCKDGASPSITFTGADATPPYTFTYTINSGTNQTVSTTGGNSISVTVPTNTASVYTYSLISVMDASSIACSQTQNGGVTVTVNPLPTATVAGTTAVCKDAATPGITFTGASATAPYTFTYTINGVTQPTLTSTGNSATVLVPTSVVGTFTYALVSVIDASSTTCSQAQSGSETVIVNPLPTATIAGSTNICKNTAPPNITFTGASGAAPYAFTYTINGGTTQTVTTTGGNSVNVPAPTGTVGTFLYELVSVQDGSITACFQLQSGTETIIVDPLPVAAFGFTDECLYQAENFNDSSAVSSGTNVGWVWNFGDSSPLNTDQSPFYTYANAGTYGVSLVTTTNNGCKDTVTKNTVVHPNPNTQFSAANVCDGTPVGFNDLTAIPSTETLQAWRWNFGDGSPFNLYQAVSGGHLYANPGSFTVQLVVVSDFGCADSITNVVVVSPNPDVDFSTNDTAGCELWCANMLDLSSVLSGSNVTWLWSFGDGNSGSEPTNCYSNDSVFAPVSFNVDLTVTSDSGCVSYLSKPNYITVYPKPIANFIAVPEKETIMNPIIFITDSSIGTNFWNWDLGDLSTPILMGSDSSLYITTFPYTYQDTGSFSITLITSTQYGCLDTAYQKTFIGPDFAFYIPNAFSPNNDGINDTFFPKGIFISKYEMMIFDRWGNLIFFTDELNKSWDGIANYGSEIAQPDVYVYAIKGTDIKRKKHNYKGIVTLVR